MVLTILDAEVEESRWQDLKNAYSHETTTMPDDIYQTLLIQSKNNPTSWRIMTQWRSVEDLEKMRNAPGTPLAVRVFQAAGAQPQLAVWDIVIHRVNKASEIFN